ncbi:hypothetical protein SLA2020_249850 [Shorea laevis]
MEASNAMIQFDLDLPSEERLLFGSFDGSPRPFQSFERDDRDRAPKPIINSKLDASAKEWDPVKERAPEDDRCLFLTFSNGHPLFEHQICRFFNYKFGPCVERVYVHWPQPKTRSIPALFGKVVFTTSCIPAMILGGDSNIKFTVDGKPLWCKKFEPKHKRSVWKTE